MKYRLLNYIVCPLCGDHFKIQVDERENIGTACDLNGLSKCDLCSFDNKYECEKCIGYEIKQGLLVCSCNKKYSIINYVPRLIEEEDAPDSKKHFEPQWEFWGDEEKIFGKTKEQMLEWCINHMAPASKKKEDFRGMFILDAGCGHGKYSEAFAEIGNEVIGMDITARVEHNYCNNLRKNCFLHFVQGDVLNPPFRKNTFDYVFSEGVIHHTGNTRAAFGKLYNLVRPGGMFGLWVYPVRSLLFEVTSKAVRMVTVRLPKKLLYCLSFIPVPVLSVVKAYSLTSLKNSSWRQCAQVIFDFFGPKYQTHHTEHEVKEWFVDEGARDMEFFDDEPVSAVGMKANNAEYSRNRAS